MQVQLQKVKQGQKKMNIQAGKQQEGKALKHTTKPHNRHQHYSIGFS